MRHRTPSWAGRRSHAIGLAATLTVLVPGILAAQSRSIQGEQLTAPATRRVLDARLLESRLTVDTTAAETTAVITPDRAVLDSRLPPTRTMIDPRVLQQEPQASAEMTEAAGASALETQAQVRVSADRVESITAGIRPKTSVPLITAHGVDSVPVVEGGFQLRRGEFAVLSTDAIRRISPPPAAPVTGGGSAGATTDGLVDNTAGSATSSPADSASFYALPFRFVTPDATLTGEWVLRPIFSVANRLRWQPDAGLFVGLFYLAIQDTVHSRESRPLPVPVHFELFSDAESLDPTTFAVAHTNLPLQRVQVQTRFAEDSVRVHIVPEFNVPGVDIWIPVAPSLMLETPEHIQGWGIETARVVARVIGTASVRPTTLSLTSTAGALDSSRIALDASGSAATSIRSAGLGGAVIDVGGPGLPVASRYIDFVFPWIFLLAALLGGVFGGFGAALQNSKAGSAPRWKLSVLKGIFAGVLAALAWYALGISLLHLDLGVVRFNELAVFTLAALGGYFGIPKPKPETARPS